MSPSTPERGDLWLAALDPVRTGEQGGTRPVLVVSSDSFNAWPVGLAVVVPLTTRERGFAHHVPVPGTGLDRASFAMPEYVRSIRQQRLIQHLGAAEPSVLEAVGQWLRRITDL